MRGFPKNILVVAAAIALSYMTGLQSQQRYDGTTGWVQPTQAPVATSSEHMLMSSVLMPDTTQQVILIDSHAKSLAVYHIQPSSGVITLRSQRNISADFRMDEFNTADPTPEKIRAILPR